MCKVWCWLTHYFTFTQYPHGHPRAPKMNISTVLAYRVQNHMKRKSRVHFGPTQNKTNVHNHNFRHHVSHRQSFLMREMVDGWIEYKMKATMSTDDNANAFKRNKSNERKRQSNGCLSAPAVLGLSYLPIVWGLLRHRQSTFLHFFTNSNIPLELAKRIYVVSAHLQNNTDRAFLGVEATHHRPAATRTITRNVVWL